MLRNRKNVFDESGSLAELCCTKKNTSHTRFDEMFKKRSSFNKRSQKGSNVQKKGLTYIFLMFFLLIAGPKNKIRNTIGIQHIVEEHCGLSLY